jgi:hypothetical protein
MMKQFSSANQMFCAIRPRLVLVELLPVLSFSVHFIFLEHETGCRHVLGYFASESRSHLHVHIEMSSSANGTNGATTAESKDDGQPASKRRRVALACNACRIRKSRCNGERPRCSLVSRITIQDLRAELGCLANTQHPYATDSNNRRTWSVLKVDFPMLSNLNDWELLRFGQKY